MTRSASSSCTSDLSWSDSVTSGVTDTHTMAAERNRNVVGAQIDAAAREAWQTPPCTPAGFERFPFKWNHVEEARCSGVYTVHSRAQLVSVKLKTALENAPAGIPPFQGPFFGPGARGRAAARGLTQNMTISRAPPPQEPRRRPWR
jgi:hypothetical protein